MKIRPVLLWILGFTIAVVGSWCNEARAQIVQRSATVNIVTPPTKWEDGTAITDPISYNIYRGPCGGAKTLVASGASMKFDVANTTPGQCFTATTLVKGSESVPTGEAVFHGLPGAAGGITVTVTIQITSP